MSDCFDHESDAYERMLNGEGDEPDGYLWSSSPRRTLRASVKTCTNCGVGGLHWQSTRQGWRLFEPDGKPHTCASKKHKPAQPPTEASVTLASILKDVRRLCDADLRALHTEVDRLIWPDEED